MSDTPITLPDLGESISEGTVGRWLKDVGEPVRRGEPIVEIQSDKVNLEVEAPADGVLAAILIAEGESAPVGAEIGRVGSEVSQTPTAAPPSPAPVAPPPTDPIATPQRNPQPTSAAEAVVASLPSTPARPSPKPVAAATVAPATSHAAAPADGPRLASPEARRLAETNGIDLATVRGSGLGGSVQAADVEAALDPNVPRSAVPAQVAKQLNPAAATPQGPPAVDGVLPLSPIRRAIAAAMTRSRAEIPDAWTSVEIEMSAAVDRRARAKDEFQRRTGAPLTLVAYCAEAVVAALAETPQVNSSWTEAGVRLHGSVNLGIAVAGPRGLVVPVVRDAQRLSLEGLALAINTAISKARADRLTPEDLQGGTFTLNNTGALGSLLTQAIPVPGQAGIVTMEAVVKRVVVLPDDSMAIRPMMNATLSFDHRIVDGAEALRFLGGVKRRLESRAVD
jgi:pyruvate/2-oxoglutarate dehydrogenase complex dihydrolipoamide acyltransferase (E2) component